MIKYLLTLFLFVGLKSYAQIGINTSNPLGIFHIDPDKNTLSKTTDSRTKDDFIVTNSGQIGIGTTNPHESALVDIDVSGYSYRNKKGLLIPRLSLKSITDQETILAPDEGLIIYNLGEDSNFTYKGFTYWNGEEWATFDGKNLKNGKINSINCSHISIYPRFFEKDKVYNGVIEVSYEGGNGGYHPAETIGPLHGLTATLKAGNYEFGNGVLQYELTGIPTVSSSESISFNLQIGDQKCVAVAGIYEKINAGTTAVKRYKIDAKKSNYWLSDILPLEDLIILNNQVIVDAYISTPYSNKKIQNFYPRLVNNFNAPLKIWFSAKTDSDYSNGSNYLLGGKRNENKSYINLSSTGLYTGYGDNMINSTSSTSGTSIDKLNEIMVVDVVLDGKWYKINYVPYYDNNDTSTLNDDHFYVNITTERIY